MSDNPGEIGHGLGAVDPLTGVSPEQGADWLRGAAKAYLDWRAGNQASVENALMAEAGKSPNELMAGAGHVDLSNPLLMAFAGPGVIKGFHGTPHTFEPVEGNPFGEFRNEAIGTGEGAQAYGWGHYVAGNPKTAETYQTTGARYNQQPSITVKGTPAATQGMVPDYAVNQMAKNFFMDTGKTPDINELENYIMAQYSGDSNFHTAVRNFWNNNKQDIKIIPGTSGNLLEVHILPHEHELLDWDKPLGEQSPGVQEKLQNFIDKPITRPGYENWSFQHAPVEGNMTGVDIYNWLTRHPTIRDYAESNKLVAGARGNEQAASAALHSAGIPGIKYLDAGSRASGSGTYNYVIFDPSNLRIVARNGQRLEPVNHDPFTAQAGKLEDMRLTREGLIPDEFGNPNFFSNLLKKGSP